MADDTIDKDDLIARFQSFTGTEELETCKQILEQYDWNIETAVAHAYDEKDAATSRRNRTADDDDSADGEDSANNGGSSSRSASSSRSTSGGSSSANASTRSQNNRLFTADRQQRILTFGPAFLQTIINTLWNWLNLITNRFFGFLIFARTTHERRDNNPEAAANRFLLNFEQNFGNIHPAFFQGSYTQALRTAQAELRLMVVYLHCEDHQHTDTFCRQTLATQQLRDYLDENNFVFWAGDIREPEAFQVSETLGASSYPFLAVIGLTNSRMSIVARMDGIISSEALIERLTSVTERLGESLLASRFEREVRESERQLRDEQEREYQESLLADQQKERRLREEREQQERKRLEEERLIREEKEREEQVRQRRLEKAQQMQAEPPADAPDITKIVVRLSDGTRVERRFSANNTIQTLYDFVETKEQNARNFRLRSNVPRVIFEDREITLREAGLCPSAAIILEEII